MWTFHNSWIFAALVAWKTTRGLVHKRCIADRWRQTLQIFEGVRGGRRSLRWNSAMASRCFGRSEKILFQSVSGLQGAELQQCKKNGRCIEQISGGASESSEAWRASAFDHLHNFKKLFEESANRGTIHFPKVISRSLSKYLWNKFSFSIVDSCEWKYLHFCLIQHDLKQNDIESENNGFQNFHFLYPISRSYDDRHRRIAYVGVQLHDKKKQSQLCLSEGTTTALRNRTQLLMQTFSISRSAEGMSWSFCDGWLFTYSRNLPGMGPTDMVACYLVQCFEKQRSVSSCFLNIFELFSDITFCNEILHFLRSICNNDYK